MEEFQKDLFPKFEGKKTKKSKRQYFSLPKTYIKLEQSQFIFLVVCFLIAIIFSYILGYKKASRKNIIKEEIQNIVKPSVERKVAIENNLKEEKKNNFIYQIQLVTYKSEKYAKEEINKLKKEGYNPFVEKKGKYRIISVGNFKSNNEAKKVLEKLKKKYKDAFIKKVK